MSFYTSRFTFSETTLHCAVYFIGISGMRRLLRFFLLPVLIIGLLVTAHTRYVSHTLPEYPRSSQHSDGRFRNALPRPSMPFWEGVKLSWTFFFGKPKGTVPDREIPVQALDRAALEAAPDGSLFRLGHSTVLLKLAGAYWLKIGRASCRERV